MRTFLGLYFTLSNCLPYVSSFMNNYNKCSTFQLGSPQLVMSRISVAPVSNNLLKYSSLSQNQHQISMAFGYDNKPSLVVIESPSINSRRITSSILIDADIDTVWSLLTDYNNLATHVPNLVRSYTVPSPNDGIRIFQEGAQKIIGFDFRASLTMDMFEEAENVVDDVLRSQQVRKIGFKLVESSMLSSFDGEWVLRCHSRVRVFDIGRNAYTYRYKTKLTYSVFVRPRGPVPVLALEWRVKEDIPINLIAVKSAVERRAGTSTVPLLSASAPRIDWGADETLGAYINSRKKPGNFMNVS